MNGREVHVDNPALLTHPHCVTGDTLIRVSPITGKFLRAFRAIYSGNLIDIFYGSGNKISVTPNHPILTSHGFIPAYLIKEGDDIIGVEFNSLTEPRVDSSKVEAANISITTAKDLFNTFCSSSSVSSVELESGAFYLHGDRVVDNKVDIINSTSDFSTERNIPESESFCKFRFTNARPGAANASGFISQSSFKFRIKRFWNTCLGYMSCFSDRLSILWRCISHPKFAGITKRSMLNTIAFKDVIYSCSTTAKILRDLKAGLSAGVLVKNKVNSLGISENGIHEVYSFETETGYYISNAIVSSNCKCHVVKEYR
jgi:intein/homing endonuclease